MLNKIISALKWCSQSCDADACIECPMHKDDERPCGSIGEKIVLKFLEQYRDMLADSDTYFGVVRWHEDDIKEALRSAGYDDCDENVTVIKKECDHHCFKDGMIETGWHYINSYIQENEDELRRCGES